MAELRVDNAPFRVRRSARAGDVSFARPASSRAHRAERRRQDLVLNCISGLYRPDGGHDPLRRRGARACAPRHRALRHRTHLPARRALPPHERGGEPARRAPCGLRTNLVADAIHLPAVRAAESAHRRRVEEILDFVELERYRHHAVDACLRLAEARRLRARLAMEPQAAARRAVRGPQPRGARGPGALHPAHQARARHRDDLGRARHADGRRPRGPGACSTRDASRRGPSGAVLKDRAWSRRTSASYLPWNLGLRFSLKARTPSLRSSVPTSWL